MLRIIRYAIWGLLGLIIILVAIANRDPVTIQLLPGQLNDVMALSWNMPLFVILIAMAAGGFILGWSWEYVREFKERQEKRSAKREVSRLQQEVTDLKRKTGEEDDDILALLK